MQINNIVVGYDGFENANPLPELALALAKEHNAHIHVVNVVERLPKRRWFSSDVSAEELHAEVLDERRQQLEAALADYAKAGLSVHAVIRDGSPHVELVRHVLDVDGDLLAITDEPIGEGARGFKTVTMKLLRSCPCPVLTQRAAKHSGYRMVMAAIDLTAESDTGTSPNDQILEAAKLLAKREGAKLLLFNAWAVWGEKLMRSRGGDSTSDVQELLHKARDEAELALNALVERHRLAELDHDILLGKGEARNLLPEAIDHYKVDLLVMGTLSRAGLPGLLIGNTAERILNSLPCSVLTIKPDDFVTPVGPPQG